MMKRLAILLAVVLSTASAQTQTYYASPIPSTNYGFNVGTGHRYWDSVFARYALFGKVTTTGDITSGGKFIGDSIVIGNSSGTGVVRFHDASQDGYYISLIGSEDISSDKTVTLPNITGTVAMMTTSNAGSIGITGNSTADSARFGTADNHVAISNEQGITLVGTATVWDDLTVPAIAGRQGALSKPDFDPDSMVMEFPYNDSTEILYFTFQMPHTWKEGSTVYPHLHYWQTSTDTVQWAMEYRVTNMGGSPTAWSWMRIVTPRYSYASGNLHQLAENTTGISMLGKTASCVVQIKLKRREGAPNNDSQLIEMDIHYEADKLCGPTND